MTSSSAGMEQPSTGFVWIVVFLMPPTRRCPASSTSRVTLLIFRYGRSYLENEGSIS